MSFTRFHDDPARMEKQLEMMTQAGRYGLDVPGNGPKPAFISDPYVRMQLWGANLRTDCIAIDSYLRGLDKTVTAGGGSVPPPPSDSIEYPVIGQITHQPRATNPAWELRGLQRSNFTYLHEDPQAYVDKSFTANINSRLMERDNFTANNCLY